MSYGAFAPTVPLGAERLGRGRQWAVVRHALENAADTGRALWLCGEPGVGKTVLLHQAGELAAAHGLRVLGVCGAEAERDIPFAALHQLLWPLMRHADGISQRGRAVLRRALELETGPPVPSYTVSAAAVELLDRVARTRPLLVAVDDLHWADASSAEVLRFLQRRVASLPVVMVATAWQEALDRLDPTGAEVLTVGPLGAEQARTLLAEAHPGLSAPARERVLREAVGNPLALVELPSRLDALERGGRLPLPDYLPLGERLERVFARRVASLRPAARFTLLLCALAGPEESARLVAVAAAAADAGDTAAHLATAQRLGLVHVEDQRVRFRHPLVRSSLVRGADGAERRRAHRAWAAVLRRGDARQVAHLAEATAAPDESVAAALVAVAAATQARGGDLEAALFHARAAALSEDPARRGGRLVTAACAAARGNHTGLAARLLDQAVAHGVPPDSRDVLDFTQALVRFHADGDVGPAVALLPALLDRLPGRESELWLPALFLLVLAAGFTADPEVWAAVEARAAEAGEIVRLGCDAWHDPARRAHGGHARLGAVLDTLPDEVGTAETWLLLWAAAGLDAVGDHAPLWRRMVDQYPYATQALAEAVSAYDDYLRGHWDRCLERSRAAAAVVRARGSEFNAAVYSYKAAYVTAARGDRQAVEDLVRDLRPWATERGLTFLVHRLRALQAACALALGDYETAYGHAAALTPPGLLPAGVSQFHLVFLDLVESALHTGRTAEARRHVAAGRAAGMDRISPHHRFVLRAAEAMVSEDVHAACTAVHTQPGAALWPFERARLRLHHGAWLRRRGRRAEARDHLAAAQQAFAGLGAGPWRERAGEELRVNDAPGPAAAPRAPVAALTPQELRIARLVAAGLSNRDIGARLQLSPRTVASHLYKVYPKLQVTTRAGVARALARAGTA
ncbi:AAA family ATPase [Streptomyces tricolor]|uniref:helix-turn-helix transcriptional regulator n=1 Tax=Streptomyces tricolor TaxID=68277 RepID=UPI0038151C22